MLDILPVGTRTQTHTVQCQPVNTQTHTHRAEHATHEKHLPQYATYDKSSTLLLLKKYKKRDLI